MIAVGLVYGGGGMLCLGLVKRGQCTPVHSDTSVTLVDTRGHARVCGGVGGWGWGWGGVRVYVGCLCVSIGLSPYLVRT